MARGNEVQSSRVFTGRALALASWLACAAPAAFAAEDKTYQQLNVLIDALEYIKQDYVSNVDAQKLLYGATNGMVEVLDPFSQYMPPDLAKDFKDETDGEFGGLGIRIGVQGDWLSVVTPMPGTPAYRAGVLPNDRIVKLDDQNGKGLSLLEASRILRGAPGTKITITVARPPAGAAKEWTPLEFALTRELIKVEAVQSRMLEGRIGYVRIIEFSAHVPRDLAKAVAGLVQDGAASLILDLRNNPGGLLQGAVETASDFLSEGKLIVYTEGRERDSRRDFRVDRKARFGSLPMIVLVNEGSASASEILAGALQDHRRALILGNRTFGKASVQALISLPDGSALRLTVAKYFTPSGRSIHRDEKTGAGGILPDIVVPVDSDTAAKLQAQGEQIYVPGRAAKPSDLPGGPVKDVVMDRAVELLEGFALLQARNPGGD